MKDSEGENEEICQKSFHFCTKKDCNPQEKESGHDHKTAKTVKIMLFFIQNDNNVPANLSNYV